MFLYFCSQKILNCNMKHIIISVFIAVFLFSCGTRKSYTPIAVPDNYSYFLIDSILQYGLDHEALFTLLGGVKPMSSLVTFSFPIENVDSYPVENADTSSTHRYSSVYPTANFERLRTVRKAVNNIQIPDVKVLMIPYRAPEATQQRIMQLSAIRISALDSLLNAKKSFFGKYGLVPGTDPNVVVSTIENCDSYDRWRGYGYLFGYPDYAVDFFVEASRINEQEGRFVERNFFQIPTYTRADGYFVYAYPKDEKPTVAVDSALYYRANDLLDKYKKVRSGYENADGSLRAYKLINDFSR